MINAISLYELINTNHDLTNLRSVNTTLLEVKWYKRDPLLFAFLAQGNEPYSSPTGHIAVVKFFKNDPRRQMLMKDCRVACTCPAFLYWGSKYNATQGKYNYKTSIDIAPNIRDPKRERKICKHIACIRQHFRGYTEKGIHRKYKDTIDKVPNVNMLTSYIQSEVEGSIPYNDIAVLTALSNAVPSLDLVDIQDEVVFESQLVSLLNNTSLQSGM